MNLTSLLAHALATSSALQTGWTSDKMLINLTDEIFRISGADACVFGSCSTNIRNLFSDVDVVDYITTKTPEQYDQKYNRFYGGGRAFVLKHNDSLPAVKTAIAACARAALPTILAEEGDSTLCVHSFPNETVDELVVHYHRAVKYNACTQQGETPELCLIHIFQLNERVLNNGARATQTIQQMLVRRLRFLTADIVDVRDKANHYLYEANKPSSGSGH
jgi:hypothetical protein